MLPQLTGSMLIPKMVASNGKYTKKVSIFSCLVQVQNDLKKIIGLLVISDCVLLSYSKKDPN